MSKSRKTYAFQKKSRRAPDPVVAKAGKKPSSPFILFCTDRRAGILQEHPHLTTPQVGRYGTVPLLKHLILQYWILFTGVVVYRSYFSTELLELIVLKVYELLSYFTLR
jgi:hypothetical protein